MNVRVLEKQRKKGTAVVLDYHDLSGKRIKRVWGRSSDPESLDLIRQTAAVEAKRIELQLMEGKYRPKLGEGKIDAAMITFWDGIEKSSRRAATLESYRHNLRAFRQFLKGSGARFLKDLTPELAMAYVEAQLKFTGSTVAAKCVPAKMFCRHCVETDQLQSNPFDDRRVKDIMPKCEAFQRAFTRQEIDAFTDYLRNQCRWPQAANLADFVTLLAETGLRKTEGLMLRWCDVKLGHGGHIRVAGRAGWKPKTTKSERSVPLSDRVEAMLQRRSRAEKSIRLGACVFADLHNAPSGKHLSMQFARMLDAAGLHEPDENGERLRLHSLRHYFATELVRAKVDPATIRNLLGHSTIVTTNRYLNVPREDLFAAVAQTF